MQSQSPFVDSKGLNGHRPSSPLVQPAEQALTSAHGGVLETQKDPFMQRLLHGVTSARTILFDPHNPARIVLRQGKNGRFGPLGGNLEIGESAVECAVREAREEGRLVRIPEMRFLTVQCRHGEGEWISRSAWDSWGYDVRGRHATSQKIWIAHSRTAVFMAPLAEPFGVRTVEGRRVESIELDRPIIDQRVRPVFRPLLHLWLARLEGKAQFPELLRVKR